MECPGNLGVQINGEALLDHKLLITLLNLLFHPVSKYIFKNSRTHIGNPLLWQLWDLANRRKIMTHHIVLGDFIGDVLDGEIVILWNSTMSHILPIDSLLCATHQVFKKVDCDLFCMK